MRPVYIYKSPAAGWAALTSSAYKLFDYKAFTRGSLSVLSSNQPNGGFDCPGCAWPDHKTYKRPLMSAKLVSKPWRARP